MEKARNFRFRGIAAEPNYGVLTEVDPKRPDKFTGEYQDGTTTGEVVNTVMSRSKGKGSVLDFGARPYSPSAFDPKTEKFTELKDINKHLCGESDPGANPWFDATGGKTGKKQTPSCGL